MRINRDRPRTRQRFSVGHEIGHTLFPGYETKVHCRKRLNRDWADKTDLVETLCDMAASEFLFPGPWFDDDVASMQGTSSEIVALAQKYKASPDATVRRFVELRDHPHAVIFFRWKLKPTERRAADAKNQRYLFGTEPGSRPQRKLRVEYSIANQAFDGLGFHIPSDKSVDDNSVISQASAQSACLDAKEKLDLGPLHGRFHVRVLPLFTADKDFGPNGELSVAALISPLSQAR
jgi:Zn-dependent peptidase ImmA (M78 family)